MPDTIALLPPEQIEQSIRLIRGQRVILDSDIAGLYGIETKVLVQAVKRNLERFPADFMFQLTSDEYKILRSQTVTSRSWGGRRYPPYVFTEQGVAMLSIRQLMEPSESNKPAIGFRVDPPASPRSRG